VVAAEVRFDNLLTLAQDAPNNENGVMYDPVTGQQKLWEWNAASRTWGIFAQDTWSARRNLTVTLGFRYDDQGNPYSRTDTTVFGNFYLGDGHSFEERVATGVARPNTRSIGRRRRSIPEPAWPGMSRARAIGWCAVGSACTPTG
jgi:outer membrane receptor protein involved in Fe transport